ncbi:hypothetical protein HOF65_02285 [bacterium]|nr:hypothetical protein [bacterium]MBT3852828.1 hypothetical protein [bacterium]MBT4632577.1 hypothetical protein [bacterium]MBT6779185.1 hypothetical protein [bacterium]
MSPSFTKIVFHNSKEYSNTLFSTSFIVITQSSIFLTSQANFEVSFCLSLVDLANICFFLIAWPTFTATSKCSSK